MKYLAAYLLASLGGNASPSAKDILNILGATAQDCDMDRAKQIVEQLSGKNLEEVIAAGKKKLTSVPSAGAAAAPAKGGAAPAAAAAAPAAAKKEEKKEESEEEDMGFGLFD